MATSQLAAAAQAMYDDMEQSLKDLETFALLHMSSSSQSELKSFANSLDRTELLLEELTKIIDREMASVERAASVAQRLRDARSRSVRLERHLTSQNINPAVGNVASETTFTDVEQLVSNEENTLTIKANPKGEKTSGVIPQLSLPTQKQFESIPKYMRSLTTYEAFAKVCRIINMAADRKRMVFEASFDKLGPRAKANLALWKNQITPDISNATFVTDDDIAEENDGEGRPCTANDIKASLQCLRNLDYVRMSPHDGVFRYIFLK